MRLNILSPIHRASRLIELAMEQHLHAFELPLSTNEAHALAYISTYGPCPTGDVQRVLGAKKSTITSLIGRLCRRSLIDRQVSESDGRSILLKISPAGRQLAKQMLEQAQLFERSLASRLEAGDAEVLQRIVVALEQESGIQVLSRTPRNQGA